MIQMTVEQLKAKMDAGEKVNLLDVREDDERREYNIGGIHHRLGLVQSMQLDPLDDLDKDELLVVYCRSGKRSMVAGMMLEMVGFKNVANLEGGMLDWQAKFG
ncbi:MAG: rhodanese-like domain-containing protein [Chitinophagaceae bacterium]|jgi:rhodanese-related sulfurtransferase|nr:rhodanese-like domain-containing protein [Chitinophagaceae bacterium]MCU0403124.1 rhodanese-like domain-containing protein [Chitinophagaceae bacterium]